MRGLATAAVITAAGACGRLEFEHLARDGGAPVDAGPPCDPIADFGVPALIPELSDAVVSDGTLRLALDELSGYFWRGNLPDQNIYFVSRPTLSVPFTISPVDGINTTTANELDPAPTSDGTLLLFRSNTPGPDDNLFAAPLITPTSLGAPVPLTAVNTASADLQCFVPLGIDELYFQSKRTAAGDIYRSVRSGTTFGTPVHLVELATGAEEGDPVVTPDGLTIYFRSNRAASLPGFNIFVARRATPTGTFGPATVVANVNTDADDGPSWISRDGCRLYISSNVRGSNDVYVSTRSR